MLNFIYSFLIFLRSKIAFISFFVVTLLSLYVFFHVCKDTEEDMYFTSQMRNDSIVYNHLNKAYASFKSSKKNDFYFYANKTNLDLSAILDLYDVDNISVIKFKSSNFYKKHKHKFNKISHIKLELEENRRLIALSFISKAKVYKFLLNNDSFDGSIESIKLEKRYKVFAAKIDSNFWSAGVASGMTSSQIIAFSKIFSWDIDFALDIRKGDYFISLVESFYVDGFFHKYGKIVAANFNNKGVNHQAFIYNNKYYNSKGFSLKKTFLRSPVDFARVSSSFSLRRLHPVTGVVKPHLGIDYAAKVGTPIKSAGAGVVIKSGYNSSNGNYIFIKHNNTYTTKYLHMHRRFKRTGSRVKQGDIIGTVGKTGLATGPHLHYEFIVNGHHRNPKTVKLPTSKPISKQEKNIFLKKISKFLSIIKARSNLFE